MDELNQNTQNSSDFQKEKMQKKNNEDNNATICDMQTDSESTNNDISIKNEIIGTEDTMVTAEDANEQLNKNCSLNRKKDEKYFLCINSFYFGCYNYIIVQYGQS